jgi:hypothetical protein
MLRQQRFQREEQASLKQYEEECRLLGRTT